MGPWFPMLCPRLGSGPPSHCGAPACWGLQHTDLFLCPLRGPPVCPLHLFQQSGLGVMSLCAVLA